MSKFNKCAHDHEQEGISDCDDCIQYYQSEQNNVRDHECLDEDCWGCYGDLGKAAWEAQEKADNDDWVAKGCPGNTAF